MRRAVAGRVTHRGRTVACGPNPAGRAEATRADGCAIRMQGRRSRVGG